MNSWAQLLDILNWPNSNRQYAVFNFIINLLLDLTVVSVFRVVSCYVELMLDSQQMVAA